MNVRLGRALGSLTVVLGVWCLCSLSAGAQAKKYTVNVLPNGGPAPRAADGHPNLSGVWFPNSAGVSVTALRDEVDPAARRQFDPKVTPEEPPSFQPWAAAKIKAMSPTELELGRSSVNCTPRGVPGIFIINPYPIQLIQTRGQLVQLIELLNNFRVIHTDGRPHAKDPDPTFNGDGVGRWEGDTLIIDTVSVDDRTWNDFVGWFHSDQQHVVERITRPSMNYLEVQVTIEDPKVLTKPWRSAPRRWSLGHEDLQEYHCTHNEELEQLQRLNELEKSKK